jgi:hypothetical protein
MSDSVEAYKIKILNLNQELSNAVNSGLKFTSISDDFKLKYKQFLLDAAQENNWPEIAENIAFYLYAGVAQNELVQKLSASQNLAINVINMAANKNEESKIIINQLHDFSAQKAEKEKKGAIAKLANDPKQQEKIIVKECWEAWQIKPDQYKNKTKFANAMIDKFKPDNPDEDSKHLSSVKVITDWCREWKASK